jgi:hypothetical protein
VILSHRLARALISVVLIAGLATAGYLAWTQGLVISIVHIGQDFAETVKHIGN